MPPMALWASGVPRRCKGRALKTIDRPSSSSSITSPTWRDPSTIDNSNSSRPPRTRSTTWHPGTVDQPLVSCRQGRQKGRGASPIPGTQYSLYKLPHPVDVVDFSTCRCRTCVMGDMKYYVDFLCDCMSDVKSYVSVCVGWRTIM
ncbi:hypothetical protein NPIL_248371 [Nephila pilipes]|uniref:Uncharacterized protein n=1 Tax=Nephila pilipes TaxID=299642 RepID=A0A8X6NVP1_NEPPI|nr:hypothetical protein NPIL_248371 [Nephila pilipes]